MVAQRAKPPRTKLSEIATELRRLADVVESLSPESEVELLSERPEIEGLGDGRFRLFRPGSEWRFTLTVVEAP